MIEIHAEPYVIQIVGILASLTLNIYISITCKSAIECQEKVWHPDFLEEMK